MTNTEREDIEKVSKDNAAAFTASERTDYGGIALEDWKQALRKDVEGRFGPTPEHLNPAGEAGW